MTFTNITRTGIYMQCCHREVEPGGTFVVPWNTAKDDRGLRAAMRSGVLTWRSGPDEAEIPGSPDAVQRQQEAAAQAAREQAAAQKAADEAKIARKRLEDEAAMKANMARMGEFDVPRTGPRKVTRKAAAQEKPVTAADVIADDKPKSLADILRHNKAVKMEHSKSSERNEHEEEV